MLRSLGLFAVCWVGMWVSPLLGQSEISVPADAKFVVQVDLDTFRHTQLGKRLLSLTQQMAAEEIGGEGKEIMQKVEESLGFNPLEEMQTLTVIGSDFENPEEHLQLMLQLGETTGNLEGMMLALPGYESEEYHDITIHSAHDDDKRAFAAIHTGDDGNKRIVASTQRSHVIEMLDGLNGSRRGGKRRSVSWVVPEGTFLQVQILEFPSEILDEDPPGNVIKMLRDVALTVGEDGDDYVAELTLTTSDEKRAEQIQQMVTGFKAMVGLFREQIEEEIGDDAEQAMHMLDQIMIDRHDSTVVIQGGVPESLIIKFLQEEADLPL